MTDSNLKATPRVLANKGFFRSGAVMFPSQITPEEVDKAQKTQEELFVGKTEEDKKFFRAVKAGIFDIPNEIKHISDWAQGNPYDPNELIDLKALGLEKEGDTDDAFYQISKFSSGFLVPYVGFSKALGKINGIKALSLEGVKHIDKVATGAKWFVAGGAADFVAIDAYDENLFNFLAGVENPIVNNGLVKPFFEFLSAPERPKAGDVDKYGKAKLKQFFAGTVFGEAVGLTATAVMKAAPILTKKLAGKSVDVIDAITRGPKILNQEQVLDRTMKLFRDIKKDPKRRNFFLQQKKKIDNATLVGSEEFSDEFTEVLGNVPDLNTTILRATAGDVYAASDDIGKLGDEIIPLPKSISRNLSKADLKDTFDLINSFEDDQYKGLLKKIGDYIEGESTTYPLSVKDTEEVNNLIQSFKTSDPTVFEEYGRLQQSIKESLGGATSDEIDEMLWRQNSDIPSEAITPEVLPAADTESKKLSEVLRENLKGLAQSDARRLREVDRILKESRAIDDIQPKTTGRQKILPGTPHPTDAKKVRGYEGRWVTKKHFDQVTKSRKGANKIRAQFDQPAQEVAELSQEKAIDLRLFKEGKTDVYFDGVVKVTREIDDIPVSDTARSGGGFKGDYNISVSKPSDFFNEPLTEVGLTKEEFSKLSTQKQIQVLRDNFNKVKANLPEGTYQLYGEGPKRRSIYARWFKDDPDIEWFSIKDDTPAKPSKDSYAVLTVKEPTFEEWVKNPPEEYKALFKEIEETSKSADENIARSKQLFKEIQSGLNEQDRLLKEGSQYDQLSPTDQKKVDLEVSLRGDAGDGGAVPPRKPPSGSSGADVPPSPDSDGFKLLKTKPNPNVWGPEEDVLRITEDMWNATAKAVNRISIPDDFTVEAATAMGYGDLLPKVKQISKLISPKDPEKHLRVIYLGAIKEQKRLAKAVSSSMADIEQAFLLGETVPDELLTQWSEDVINMIQLTAPTKTISSEVAGTLRVNQLIDAEPKHVATTTVDEDVAKGLSGGESVAERAKKDKYQPTTRDLVKKTKKDITEKKAVPTKEELLEGLKSYIDSDDVEGLLGITRKILAMQGDSKRLSKLTQGLGFWGRANRGMQITNEIFINSLLSAPETHIVNIVGSLMNVALGPLDLAAGSPILDKESKARAARELVKIFTSTADNFKAAGKALYLDKNILDERRMFGQDVAERYALRMAGDNYLAKTINLVGHGVRIPGRFMMAGDEFVKQAAFRSHLWGELTEQATKQGLTGQSWKIYVNSNFDEVMDIVNKRSIREGTDEYILDAYTRALDYAADRTFTDELGKGFFMNGVGSELTKKTAQILKATPLKPVVPFVTTPINIGKHVLRRTGVPDLRTLTKGMPPKHQATLGRILKEHNDRLMSEDLATAYRANGEATVGGAIWAYFIALAAAKDDPEAELALVGGGHHNKWIRQNEQRSEELPYSFRTVVKDKNGKVIRGADGLPKYEYLDFLSRMEPVASLLMISSDMAYCRDFVEDEDYENAAQCQIALLSRNLNNKYMIQNIAQLFDLTSDTNALQRFLRIPANYASSMVNYPASLKRSIVRARGEEWFDELTQREYKGRFPKRKVKMRKGDIKPQEIRTEDVGQYFEDEFPFEGNDLGSLKDSNNPFQLLDTFGLMIMRNLQDGTSGFSADIEPIRSITTGEIATYPEGAFYGDYFNPFKYRKSKNNPIDSYIRRIGVKLIEPSDVIPYDNQGNGINLTTPEYNKMKNLIPFLPLNPRTGQFDPKDGVRFGDAILKLARDKDNLKALAIIESDDSGAIDAQATLKRKDFLRKQLQKDVRNIYRAYKQAAVQYYKDNYLDPEKKAAMENEVRRSNKDIMDILEK